MHISSQSNEPVGYDSENFSESSTTGSDNSELSTKELSAERRGVGERLTEIIEDTRTTLKMFYTGTERNIRQNGPENFLSYPEAFGFSTRLDGSVAKYLIKKGFLYEVVEHKDRFIDLALDKDTALNFIKERKGVSSVLENREMFPDLTQQEIIKCAEKHGHGASLVYTLDFLVEGVDNYEIREVYVLDLLDLEDEEFEGLDKSLALEFIKEKGDVPYILKYQEVFRGLSQQEIIECAEKHGHGVALVCALEEDLLDLEDEEFEGLDENLALIYLEGPAPDFGMILRKIEVFPDLTQQEIIDSAVDSGHGVELVHALDFLDLEDGDFKGLDKSLALKYIEETRSVSHILENKEVFPDLTVQEVMEYAEKNGISVEK